MYIGELLIFLSPAMAMITTDFASIPMKMSIVVKKAGEANNNGLSSILAPMSDIGAQRITGKNVA